MRQAQFVISVRGAIFVVLMACGVVGAQPSAHDVSEYEVYYHHVIRNKSAESLNDVRVYLPVPQGDAYQQIADFRVECDTPVHISNRTDGYGTKLKRISIAVLEPGQSVDVGFSCVVSIREPNKVSLGQAKGRSLDEIPEDIRNRYTIDAPIFGLQTQIIQSEAQRLLRAFPDPADRAKAIHDLIAGTFKYKSGDGWDRAPQVLERRSGSCTEFSYVFCALCRATGIPTRLVGGSIFPVKSKMPFVDTGWHRWAEAYLPGIGWASFDATLDRAATPKPDFVGSHHPRVLILSRIGTRSTQLGLSYIGANSHTGQTSRSRQFVWSQGLMRRLHEAEAALQTDQRNQALEAMRALIAKYPGTRAASEAARLLQVAPSAIETEEEREEHAPSAPDAD
jgi:transglutaminase-like putative cysteine protease